MPVRVSRVSDQDREFLEFIERHDLKPGAVVEVEERDSAADSVRLRGARQVTIGARAASKVLVTAAEILVLVLALAASAVAQPPATPPPQPFGIADNSFLVEEAFNQESGVFQNIVNAVRVDGTWASTFTQEWPLASQTHQLSYTLSWARGHGASGFGDTLLNYRYQAVLEGRGRPAFSPRVSLILPTAREGFGDDATGVQLNLPFSKQTGEVYWHWNAGMTWLPAAAFGSETRTLTSPFLAGSAILRVRRMLHAMIESLVVFDAEATPAGATRHRVLTLSPGARGGWDIGDRQVIVGLAVPVTWTEGAHDEAAFVYVSYELPFRR
jgi:hypothetical protein